MRFRAHCCAHLQTGRRPVFYKHDAQASESGFGLPVHPGLTHSLARRACISSLWLAAKMCTAVGPSDSRAEAVAPVTERAREASSSPLARKKSASAATTRGSLSAEDLDQLLADDGEAWSLERWL